MHSQEARHLHQPAHVVRVHLVLDRPLGQTVPLVPRAAVDGQAQLHVLVFAFLQVLHHLLRRQRREEET